MDLDLSIAAGLGTFLTNPVVQNVIGNRADRGIDAVLTGLSKRWPGDVSFDVDIAYAAWWSCLCVGVLACSNALEEGGKKGGDRRQIGKARRRFCAEVRRLEKDRKRYFQRRTNTGAALEADPDGVRRYLNEPDALLRYFREWIERELDSVPAALEPQLAPEPFAKQFGAYMAEAVKRDERARIAYDSVVMQSIQGVVLELAERKSPPELDQVVADLSASSQGIEQLVSSLAERESRREQADELAATAVGRNARLLVEQRVDELAERPLVGREDALAELRGLLDERESGSILITAPPGYGKSSLLAHWLRDEGELFGHVAYHFVDIDRGPQVSTRERLFGNLLGQMLPLYGMPLDVTREAEGQVGALLDLERPIESGEEPLLLLIDGLDEITDWDSTGPTLLLPSPMPPNVFVIASVRSDPSGSRDLAPNWDRDRELSLARLPRGAIGEALGAYREGELRPYADDAEICARLENATGGIPLYLDFAIQVLAEEARAGRPPAAALAEVELRTASSEANAEERFASFLRGHLRQLHATVPNLTERPEYRLLQLLVASGDPLYEDDLVKLEIDPLALVDLRIMRWIAGPEAGAYSLPHRFLGGALARAFGEAAMEQGRTTLRRLALSWAKSPTPYAARHLPALLEAELENPRHADKARRALLEISSNRGFLKLQAELVRDEPELRSKTLARAATVALEADDGPAAIDLALLRIDLGNAIESPLQALRAKAPLTRLVRLVQAFNSDAQVSWCALVELLLGVDRRDEQAAFRTWRADHLPASAPLSFQRASSAKIDQALIAIAARRSEIELAEWLAEHMNDECDRSIAFAILAEMLAAAGEKTRANEFAAKAQRVAAEIEPASRRSGWLVRISQRLEGKLSEQAAKAAVEACETAEGDRDDEEEDFRAAFRLSRAANQALAVGERDAALAAAQTASQLAQHSTFEVAYTARALASAGEGEGAIAAATQALAEAGPADWEGRRFAAEALAIGGDPDRGERVGREALRIAEQIEEPHERMTALKGVARTLACLGDEAGLLGARTALAAAADAANGTEPGPAAHKDRETSETEMADRFIVIVERDLLVPDDCGVAAIEQVGEALERRVRYERKHRADSTFLKVASALAEAGFGEESLRVARSVGDDANRAAALAEAARAFARAGGHDQTIELAMQAFEIVSSLEGDLPAKVIAIEEALPTIAEALATTGEARQAVEVARSQGSQTSCRALIAVAKAQDERGEHAASLAATREAIDAAGSLIKTREEGGRRIQRVDARAPGVFASCALLFASQGEEEQAVEVARMAWDAEVGMLREGILISNAPGESLAAVVLAEGLERAQEMSRSAGETSAIETMVLCAESLNARGHRGEAAAVIEGAVRDAWSLAEGRARAALIGQTAPLLAEVGDADGARRAVEEMERQIDKLKDRPYDPGLDEVLASGLLAVGETEAAVAAAERLLKFESPHGRWRSGPAARMVDVLVLAGREDVAIRDAQSLDGIEWRSDALTKIARSLAKAKRPEPCFRVTHEALLSLA
jgi:hypothetical protein